MAILDVSADKAPAATEVSVAGAAVSLEPEGGAFLPDERVLIVSDLHLEKGSSYAARGVLLPPYDTRATLGRLAALIDRLAPRVVISLGDSFHDDACEARMGACDLGELKRLVALPEDWIWIEGNHDPRPPAHIGGQTLGACVVGSLTFRHEPQPRPALGEVAGHLHPCVRVSGRGRSVRRRAFLSDGARLVMPAFGAYTGGLNICDPAFAGLFSTAPKAFALGQDRVWPISARRLRAD